MLKESENGLLQSALDAIGFNSNLPLRILNISALKSTSPIAFNLDRETNIEIKETYYSILSTLENRDEHVRYLHQLYSSPNKNSPKTPIAIDCLALHTEEGNLNRRYETSVEKLKNLERSFFPTYSANSAPIEDLFCLSNEWKWFELVWLFHNENNFIRDGKVHSMNAFGLKNWSICYKNISTDPNYVILCGPYRENENTDLDNELLLEGFCRFQQTYGRYGLTKRFSAEDMERVVNARETIPENELFNRLETAEKVLSFVLNNCRSFTSLPNDKLEECLPRRALVERLSNVAHSAARIALSRGLMDRFARSFNKSIIPFFGKQNRRSSSYILQFCCGLNYFRDDSDYFSFGITIENKNNSECMELDWNFTPQVNITSRKQNILAFAQPGKSNSAVNIENNNAEYLELCERVLSKFERWLNTTNTRRSFSQALKSKLIGDWLNHQFLTTTVAPRKRLQANRDIAVYNYLSEFIATASRADACMFYRYYSHMQNGDVSVLGKATNSDICGSDDLRLVQDKMIELSSLEHLSVLEKAKYSLVYDVAIKRRSAIRVPSSAERDVEKSNLHNIHWPDDCTKPDALVAVPILVEGRLWGVIELVFLHRSGAEQREQLVLNEFASVLSVYLFSITYNKNIAEVGYWGSAARLEEPGITKEIANNLAERVCRINLARAVLILTKAEGRKGNYRVEGVCGYDLNIDGAKDIVFNVETDNLEFLSSRLYHVFKNKEIESKATSFVSGRLVPNEEDSTIYDHPTYYLLGEKYFSHLEEKVALHELVTPAASQIVAYSFNVEANLDQDLRVFGIDLGDVSSQDDGPTGMVIVYHDVFINRQHWYGVNTDISQRLANCYRDILVSKREIENRGRIIRHEVRHTVKSLAPVSEGITASANRIQNEIRKLSIALEKIGSTVNVSESFNSIKSEVISLSNRNQNFQRLYEQLNAQTESIERGDYNELFAFDGLVTEEFDSDQSPLLLVALRDAITQFRGALGQRSIHVDITSLRPNLRIRIRPQYLYLLTRNIFDNWAKYAKPVSTCKIELSPEYNAVSKPEYYFLTFTNECETLLEIEKDIDWFAFGYRFEKHMSSDIEGDGIGLFWIKNILAGKHNIPVTVQLKKHPKKIGVSTFVLTWQLKPHWLTLYAD